MNQARIRMGAGKSQPGIGAMLKSAKVKANLSTMVKGSGVVTSREESSLEAMQDDEMRQGAHSLEDVQDDALSAVESQIAHCLVEGMHQGAHSMEDVKEHKGGGEEGRQCPC